MSALVAAVVAPGVFGPEQLRERVFIEEVA